MSDYIYKLNTFLKNDVLKFDKPQIVEFGVREGRSTKLFLDICNEDRSIGAAVSGKIVSYHGNLGMLDSPITFRFKGTAGQSFGVWNAGGLNLYLEGDANDYVGKGMTGGKIIITPPLQLSSNSQEFPIIGNTCLYGATGGLIFASGRAGERFAVRNSGAFAVIEGAGDHCCEYMTDGVVCVLGKTGYNFGSGMTGGVAYVLDLDNTFIDCINTESVEIQRINCELSESQRSYLEKILEQYVEETESLWGSHIFKNIEDYIRFFWLVKPKSSNLESLIQNIHFKAQ